MRPVRAGRIPGIRTCGQTGSCKRVAKNQRDTGPGNGKRKKHRQHHDQCVPAKGQARYTGYQNVLRVPYQGQRRTGIRSHGKTKQLRSGINRQFSAQLDDQGGKHDNGSIVNEQRGKNPGYQHDPPQQRSRTQTQLVNFRQPARKSWRDRFVARSSWLPGEEAWALIHREASSWPVGLPPAAGH